MSVSVTQQQMFVDGAFVDALSGETMEVLNPATGEVIAAVEDGSLTPVEPIAYPMVEAGRALRDLLERRVTGKACLTP